LLFPLRFVYIISENMPWHNQIREEMYLDNEMAPNPTLFLFIFFSSASQLLITSKPSNMSSPLLTKDWL
jgi:hypothetical protein